MKKFLSLLLVAMMVIVGCAAVSASAEEEQITLYMTTWESDTMNESIQKACDEVFSVEHPNIKVVVIPAASGDFNQMCLSMISAGDNLDVFQTGFDNAVSNYQKGLTYDWTEYAEKDSEFMDGFYTGAMNGYTYDGHVVGLPGLANVYGFFYNKDMIAEKGLAEPTSDWTWDDFFTLIEGLAEPENEVYGCYNFSTDIFGCNQISASEGGALLFDDFTNNIHFNVDDKLVEACTKISNYIQQGVLPARTYSASSLQSEFESGHIAMLYYGQWEINTLITNAPDLNWGFAPIPTGSVTRANAYDYVGWSAKKDLEHPDETWELMKFLASTVYETVLVDNPVAACGHADSAQAFFDTVAAAGHQDAADAVASMMSEGVRVPSKIAADWKDDAAKIWDPTYNNIMDGIEGTPEDLVSLAAELNELIDEGF